MTAYHQPATLYHLTHLAAIEITGDDAQQFLQGQLTCDIRELTDGKASIAAFCNPKGRAISTLLAVKSESAFLLIAPESLLPAVLKKLQMYVLRSKVKLSKAEHLILTGLAGLPDNANLILPDQMFHCSNNAGLLCIKMPSARHRFLCVGTENAAHSSSWRDLPVGPLNEWRYQDISSGFPWFELSRAEHYIPQMLNIDQLGGISFNKGCYTGQEIIARTHYLGKAKRQLYLAECEGTLPVDADLAIKNPVSLEKCGDILALQSHGQTSRMLLVLQTVDAQTKNLILDDAEHTPVTLIPFQ